MNDFINMSPEQMTGVKFDCKCGLTHSVDLEKVLIGSDILDNIPEIVSQFKDKGRIYIVSDNNTFPIAGKKVCELLESSGFNIKSFMFETKDHQLNPNEKTLGRLLYELGPDISVLIAVGSGVINDVARAVAYRVGVKHIIVGTAASMDGYASDSSPLVIGGFKISSFDAYPKAIVLDTKIMKDAPMIMIQAGLGDVLGKITSLADWNLSRILKNEHYCDVCVDLMKRAVQKCIDNIDNIKTRDEVSIGYIGEALVLAGIAMSIYTSTRPASSTEHYFAHYWDVVAIAEGKEHPLHGNSVGVGTVIACDAYEYMKDLLPKGFDYPKTEYIVSLFKKIDSAINPKDIGISRELFTQSVLHCIDNRIKYGILNFARENGMLEEVALYLTQKYYGKE